MLRPLLPEAALYLTPDPAFFLETAVTRIKSVWPTRELEDVFLYRVDKERRSLRPAPPPNANVCDWNQEEKRVDMSPLVDYREAGLGSIIATELDEVSWSRFCRGYSLLSGARRVVTDRLHGHILSCLLGKPHVLLDNSYGKNGSFFKSWESDLPPFASLSM